MHLRLRIMCSLSLSRHVTTSHKLMRDYNLSDRFPRIKNLRRKLTSGRRDSAVGDVINMGIEGGRVMGQIRREDEGRGEGTTMMHT